MNEKNSYEKLFYEALRIRRVEERISEIYPTDRIQSPVHLSIGQEAVATGVCASLAAADLLYSSYRSHAFYLAKGGDLNSMFAELYGKATGGAKGKGGSMHLAQKSVGFMGSSAIVGSTIPHAVGSAMAAKLRKTGQVCVAVFGDGATEEGAYHESLNFASVFQLPAIFVCENNGLAIHSKPEQRQAYLPHEHAKSYGLGSVYIEEGYNLVKVAAQMQDITDGVRQSGRPYFVEIKTYRYREHVGVGDDHHEPYRDVPALERWQANDPLLRDTALIQKYEPVISREIDAAVRFAEQSPDPDPSELLSDIC
jgi:pyruvate dehydrogenase E1 component alpha subunit